MTSNFRTPMRNRADIETVGARIRNVRLSLGLTLADVEEKHGIKAVVLGSWERADRNITADQLYRVARALGVTVATLLPEGEATPTPLSAEVVAASLQTMALELGELTSAMERIRQHLDGEVAF